MIEETGTVKSISGMMAIVSVPRKSTCEGCQSGTCMPGAQSMEIEAVNKAGAAEGQRVRILIRSSLYLKGSLVVYGIPALGLVVGAVLGKEYLAGLFSGSDPDVVSAVTGFAVFGLSLGLVKLWSALSGTKNASKPVIEEILK